MGYDPADEDIIQRYLYDIKKRQRSRGMLDFVLRIYIPAGLIIAFISMAYFFYSYFDLKLDEKQRTLLLITGSGVAISLISWIMLLSFKKLSQSREDQFRLPYNMRFLEAWLNFEVVAKKLLLESGARTSILSITQILDQLYMSKIITDADFAILKDGLAIRNIIFHEGLKYPEAVLAEKISRIDYITEKLINRLNIK